MALIRLLWRNIILSNRWLVKPALNFNSYERMDIYFIDQSLTNIYEYTVESNSLYKISEFNNFFNTEIFSNLKILEMIYNVLYDCEEHGFEIKDEKGRYYNCRLIPNTLIQGTLGVLLIKENVSEQYNIKAIHEQKYNEFKSIIDNIPYDLILEKDKKIIAEIYPNEEYIKSNSELGVEKYLKKAIETYNKDVPMYRQVNDIVLRDSEFPKTTTKKIRR